MYLRSKHSYMCMDTYTCVHTQTLLQSCRFLWSWRVSGTYRLFTAQKPVNQEVSAQQFHSTANNCVISQLQGTSNCVVFRPETNWMNPRPLKGQYALLGQKFHKFISSRNTLTHTQISFLSTAKTWFGLPNGHTKLVIILHIRIFC